MPLDADSLSQEAVARGGTSYGVNLDALRGPAGPMLSVTIPIRLPSLSNVRMHWAAMNRLKKTQAAAVFCYLADERLPALPATVTLTRIGKRTLDSGNLEICFKAVQDQIAKMYGVDDGSPLYRWKYDQERGKEYAVRVEIKATLEGKP